MSFDTHRAVAAGDPLPQIRRRVTQRMIDLYAEVSGDRNPLHVDPDFAARTPFGGTIAHGMMTLAFASQMMSRWNAEGWASGGGIDIAFVAPVRPGEDVVAAGTVRAVEMREGTAHAVCDVTCSAGGRTVMAGTALCPLDGAAAGAST